MNIVTTYEPDGSNKAQHSADDDQSEEEHERNDRYSYALVVILVAFVGTFLGMLLEMKWHPIGLLWPRLSTIDCTCEGSSESSDDPNKLVVVVSSPESDDPASNGDERWTNATEQGQGQDMQCVATKPAHEEQSEMTPANSSRVNEEGVGDVRGPEKENDDNNVTERTTLIETESKQGAIPSGSSFVAKRLLQRGDVRRSYDSALESDDEELALHLNAQYATQHGIPSRGVASGAGTPASSAGYRSHSSCDSSRESLEEQLDQEDVAGEELSEIKLPNFQCSLSTEESSVETVIERPMAKTSHDENLVAKPRDEDDRSINEVIQYLSSGEMSAASSIGTLRSDIESCSSSSEGIRRVMEEASRRGGEFHLEDLDENIRHKLGSRLNPKRDAPFSDARALARKFSIRDEQWSQFDERKLFENIITYLTVEHMGKFTVRDLLNNLIDIKRPDVALILAHCVTNGHMKAECHVCQVGKSVFVEL